MASPPYINKPLLVVREEGNSSYIFPATRATTAKHSFSPSQNALQSFILDTGKRLKIVAGYTFDKRRQTPATILCQPCIGVIGAELLACFCKTFICLCIIFIVLLFDGIDEILKYEQNVRHGHNPENSNFPFAIVCYPQNVRLVRCSAPLVRDGRNRKKG